MKKAVLFFAFLLSTVLLVHCNKKEKASCTDGKQNQDETAVDCGGTCSPCETCSDGIKNQDETAVDCGGVCAACSTCSDGIQNGNETGVDCGGSCFPCPPTPTNPATQNTSLQVGGSGWLNANCSASSSLSLVSINGQTNVYLNFGSAMTSGTYAISTGTFSPNTCQLTVTSAPNQPPTITWYGKTGSVIVNATSTGITATINNVICTQTSFNFPVVAVSGTMGCQP
jgi:hypothetical protein